MKIKLYQQATIEAGIKAFLERFPQYETLYPGGYRRLGEWMTQLARYYRPDEMWTMVTYEYPNEPRLYLLSDQYHREAARQLIGHPEIGNYPKNGLSEEDWSELYGVYEYLRNGDSCDITQTSTGEYVAVGPLLEKWDREVEISFDRPRESAPVEAKKKPGFTRIDHHLHDSLRLILSPVEYMIVMGIYQLKNMKTFNQKTLETTIHLSPSIITKHLRVLEDRGIVTREYHRKKKGEGRSQRIRRIVLDEAKVEEFAVGKTQNQVFPREN